MEKNLTHQAADQVQQVRQVVIHLIRTTIHLHIIHQAAVRHLIIVHQAAVHHLLQAMIRVT